MTKDKSRRWFPLYPDSVFKSSWDFIAMTFIIYQAIVIPYRYCFKARAFGVYKWIDLFMDTFFIVDLGKRHFLVNIFFISFELLDWLLQKGKLGDEAWTYRAQIPQNIVHI